MRWRIALPRLLAILLRLLPCVPLRARRDLDSIEPDLALLLLELQLALELARALHQDCEFLLDRALALLRAGVVRVFLGLDD